MRFKSVLSGENYMDLSNEYYKWITILEKT